MVSLEDLGLDPEVLSLMGISNPNKLKKEQLISVANYIKSASMKLGPTERVDLSSETPIRGMPEHQPAPIQPVPPSERDRWKGTQFEGQTPEEIVINNNNFTIKVLLPLWMSNFARNMKDIIDGRDVTELPRRDTSAIVIGAGPSVEANHQLHAIKESGYRGTIICTDRMLIDCLRAGIIPTVITSTDGDPSRIAAFFTHVLVKEHAPEILAVFISTTSPNTVKRWKEMNGGELFWFNAFLDDPEQPTSLTKAMHFMSQKTILHVPGNCGAFSWNLAILLGCNPVALVGLDYGYLEDTPLEQTSYYQKFMQTALSSPKIQELPPEKRQEAALEEVKKLYKVWEHPFFKVKYKFDIMWDGYKTMFLPYLRMAKLQQNIRTIQCSPGHLWDDSLEYLTLQQFVHKYKV